MRGFFARISFNLHVPHVIFTQRSPSAASNFDTFPMGVCQTANLCYMSRPLRTGFLRIPVFFPLHARFPLPVQS
ncbi:MAG: hypothetical protein JWL81_2 [Verrucomicrobiales bacterium]|nr:hypothetical protein [Verrucomicrobiales bacterium]